MRATSHNRIYRIDDIKPIDSLSGSPFYPAGLRPFWICAARASLTIPGIHRNDATTHFYLRCRGGGDSAVNIKPVSLRAFRTTKVIFMTQTFIPGKDAALEDSIARFQQKLLDLGFHIEEASWLNPVPNVWSVHIRDKECALCFTNGKGATKKAALASALGEYFERLSTNYFFADFWLGETIANGPFVHYPNEKWFPLTDDDALPEGLLDDRLRAFYDPENELAGSMLIDLQSGNEDRGICGLPFTRQSDNHTVYIPMNIIGNLYVSNGMSAGNTRNEARVQGLSEVFERQLKTASSPKALACRKFQPMCWHATRQWLRPSLSWRRKVSQSSLMTARWAVSIRLSASSCSTRPTAPASPPSARILISALRWSAPSPSCCKAVG